MGILESVGYTLDTPGALLRGLLAGKLGTRVEWMVEESRKRKLPVLRRWIPAGTPVKVKRRSHASRRWRSHRTQIDLNITETLKRTHTSVTFAHDDWVISVALKYVRQGANQHPKRIQTTSGHGLPSACVGQGTKPGDGP